MKHTLKVYVDTFVLNVILLSKSLATYLIIKGVLCASLTDMYYKCMRRGRDKDVDLKQMYEYKYCQVLNAI